MINVFIADDHSLIIEGLKTALATHQGVKVVGYSLNAKDCMHYCKNHEVDVILMDIQLPDESGIELCKKIKTSFPKIQVIALSTFSQGSYIQAMKENGASGYILKNAGKNEIITAIETVYNGHSYFSIGVSNALSLLQEKQKMTMGLTKRENEILKLIAEGLTNAQIATKLFISIDTVDTHRKNLYFKLDVNNTALLIKKGIELNLI